MLKVYTASCMRHASKWRILAERGLIQVEFTALWPYEPDLPDDPANCSLFWRRDFNDIIRSDAVLVYAEPNDRLRGALIEAGIAIGLGKFVVVCGEHDCYGSWQHHPSVHRASDLNHALWMLEYLGRHL